MMIFVPVAAGILIGLVLLLCKALLRKKAPGHIYLIRLPAWTGVGLSMLLAGFGYFIVRGFEGAAYGVLALTTLLCSAALLALDKQKSR